LLSVAPVLAQDGSSVHEVVAVFREISALKEASRLKDEFVSVVSHELRADAHEAVTRATLLAGACLAATVSEYLASVA